MRVIIKYNSDHHTSNNTLKTYKFNDVGEHDDGSAV